MFKKVKKLFLQKENSKLATPDNNLKVLYPDVARFWHPEFNKDGPEDVKAKSGKLRWWKCGVADDHVWEAKPVTIVKSFETSKGKLHGCPMCAGKKLVKSNCLESIEIRI